jgi:hypothetical protein
LRNPGKGFFEEIVGSVEVMTAIAELILDVAGGEELVLDAHVPLANVRVCREPSGLEGLGGFLRDLKGLG